MTTTILVDGNNLGMAAHFASSELRDMDGRPVGAVFGFIRMLRAIVERAQIDEPTTNFKVAVAWDSKPTWRDDLLPEYKSSRKEGRTPELEKSLQEYGKQVPRLRAVLTTLGVHQLRAENFEADDIAGYVCKISPNVILVSGDKDWLQLVRPGVKVWQVTKGQFVTVDNFEAITAALIDSKKCGGCTPDQFTELLAIAGDTGDDVPGVKGVGMSTALLYVKGLSGEMPPLKGKKADAIAAWMTDPNGYTRSKTLVDLRNIYIPIANFKMTPGAYDPTAFMNECIVYGFESILKSIADWIRPFEAAPASLPVS